MIDQEQLRDLTESYLKSVIAEASGSSNTDFDASAPFGELGIDSFHVLKIIKALETDFGTLPKSLLFENFNINDLADYFVAKHEETLSAKFGNGSRAANSVVRIDRPRKTDAAARVAGLRSGSRTDVVVHETAPILILEKEAYSHPELKDLVRTLFDRYKNEGCVSRGTRKIAPNLFIGSARRGYFNYGRGKDIVLVYGYTGPRHYFPALAEEMYRHCLASGFQLNVLADEQLPPIGGTPFSATPFGVLQRIVNLKEFTLDGGAMRRLRYQVAKFQKLGTCRTEEYRCGSNSETDQKIAGIIDRWCAPRTMVNPLIHDFKADVLAGTLAPEHRVFSTYLDDVMQNVILITPMSAAENGYLMDLEFYPPEMPMGGLELTILRIIERLAGEGCDVLSLGGTYGCKLESSDSADPEIDKILDDLREQNVFNDAGNLQFKNKFRPESKTVFLCRPVGAPNPGNVIDIIMMIADPEKMQTSDAENQNYAAPGRPTSSESTEDVTERSVIGGDGRARILSESGFNPLNIPSRHVESDLKTDSWAQLEMPAIEAQMRHLHGNLQQPVSLDDTLRAVFPFAHFVLTGSGQAAEHIFFEAWPKKGLVPQNLLFPSTIFHQIDNGFTPREIPHPAVFQLDAEEPWKGNMAWDALETELERDPDAIAFACIEVSDNAAGGCPVSMQHLRSVKARLAEHSIPLVIDATRVVENAQFLIDRDKEHAGKSVWAAVREILSCADAVIGSLTKDFCIDKGGIIATNDVKLFQRLQELVDREGAGLDLIEKKVIALSFQNRKQIEARVLRRMESVGLIWRALKEHDVPVAHPVGGHCILIDVKQIPEFDHFTDPVASFLAWLYLNTGIRAGAHSAGMQRRTPINDLVRLAIPVGLKRDQIDGIIDRLIHAFEQKVNIPEVVVESSAPRALGDVHATYKLVRYHRMSGNSVAENEATSAYRSPTPTPAGASPSTDTATAEPVFRQAESSRIPVKNNVRRQQDVAVVGIAGRYPKAKTPRELWENLARGRDCIEEIPADRREWRLQHGSAARYRGGFIDDVDKFDSLFFSISPREAEMLDPQERLFLEVAWEVIEDAGYYPDTLAQDDGSRNVGVFVGAVWAMYQMLGVEEKYAANKIVPNSFLWSIANRVSYCLNLSGPSLTVDTACSSSLTALYLACEAIYAGECSAAIVGGVNLDLHQAKFDINHTGGALSPDGVCRSFGKGANGYVMGEGVGALLLKPLDRAVQDGDHVYGVIKSAVVNHGGRTSGYTVPDPKAQASLISEALERANIGARTIGYIEAHGTGTALGDPVEISGLSKAFSADAVANQSCAIGSIKSNIGHLEAAAGVVSVSKVLLQMKQRQLVPSLHSSEPNEFIDFANSPFYVPQQLQEWKGQEVDGVRVPLRAGVSSFGAGGSNAHIILESYEPAQQAEEPAEPDALIFPLSARSEDQLREAASRLTAFLRESDEDFRDIAHTLQAGRKSFDHRVAVIASAKDDLLAKLASFITAKKSEDVVVGHVKNSESITRLLNRREKGEFVRLFSQSGDPHKIAALWAEGLLSDWQGFPSHGSRNKVSLPTYPFADKRHWAFQKSTVRRAFQSSAAVHPMLDSNESTFERQLFKKTFNDRDFFIYDHHVSDIPTLPGVAYLELARKAGEIAAGRKIRKIKNILWVSPIAVQNSTPKEVFVELKPSDATVRFEVFSNDDKGGKVLHSQGTLLYETLQETTAEPESIDLEAIRARCTKVTDGKTAYPLFKSFGLNLGPSFQVLQEVYKNETETLGALKLPELRAGDLESMALPPSLLDGSLQAGMAAQLGGQMGEMYVPYSIGEVEILQPLVSNCFSYVTEAKEGKKSSRVLKSNVLIVDETGKVLVKIRESVGVPLGDIFKKPAQSADAGEFSKLYYSYEWEKAALAASGAAKSARRLLIFDTSETLRDLYRARLREAGVGDDDVILVRPGEAFQDSGNHSYTVNPHDKDDFTRLFGTLAGQQRPVEDICFAWPLGDNEPHDQNFLKQSLERGVYSFLFVCQALIEHKMESAVQLLYVHSSRPDEVQPHHDAVRGFVNTLRLEHSKLLCKTVEVRREGVGYEPVLDAVAAEFQARTQDAAAVRYEGQERSIKKLKAFDLEPATGAPASEGARIRENGVYLITGGAGGLGLIFAEYLAKEHKAKLILTGRSTLSAEREARLDELRKAGAEVLYVPADVSNYEDVEKVVNEAKSRFGAIHGVIHAAGVLRDSLIRNKTAEEMSAVFAPKVHGTLHLDEVTKNEGLDFFVTFSSLASVTGNAGQCDYSFANHFMDSFAAGRELLRAKGARSGKTLSINWSIWAGGGMRLDEQAAAYFKKTLGISPLSAAAGLDAFVRGLASARTQFAALEGVQEKVELAWGLRKKQPAAEAPASATQTVSAPAGDQLDGDLRARLQNGLTQIVMEFLKLDADDVSPDKILLDLGFDSIGLTSFANAINDKYQLDITPVLFFDYPSLAEITKYLCTEHESEIRRFYGGSASEPVTASPPAQPVADVMPLDSRQEAKLEIKKGWTPAALDRDAVPRSSDGGFSPEHRFVNEPIAIVGMSGVMPQSEDLDEFWENLKESTDMITLIPPDRWRWEDFYGDPLKESNKTNSKWGGFMKEVDKFDALFFGISPREAHMMDPQQRIFLETVWKAIEDSGQKVSDLSGTKTGLFVGVATNDYIDVLRDRQAVLDGYSAAGNSHSVLANRVSFLLNLRGPSAPIDTACSSSLVALHRAIESIHTRSCDMAIVGGVQVMLTPAAYISFSAAGMLSPDGKCKSFDKSANGYVRGEGSGAIFIKRLSAAEADGNHIYAVIKATAENHGGKVTTLTAPNSSAQAELLIEAYEKAQIDPSTVGYIECHGTGTSLGDPIEIQALNKAFSELYKKRSKPPAATPHCGLSSVKTNIGHLETAAGIAGMLKALLAIEHKQIPANIHFEELNPYINLKGSPFYIADKLTPWPAPIGEDGLPAPRRAGVSSFGFGGANAHIVLEEYIPPQRQSAATADGPQLIVLSAKNEDRLKAYVRSMLDYLGKREVELIDLAYTLQVGRDEMPERLALVAASTAELKQKLNEILDGGAPTDAYRNNITSKQSKSQAAEHSAGDAAVQALIERKDLSKVAELWVCGAKIDWRLLHKASTPRRISVPTYPFARERYWIPALEGLAVESRQRRGSVAAELLHPLVHRNTSTLQEQKFSSRFSGDEFFFADHVVETQKILPGVAYLEMARAAGELSGSANVRVIRNLTWERPLIIDNGAKDVEVSLSPARNGVKFAVKTVAGESAITHCTGTLAYEAGKAAPEFLDISGIRERCSQQVMSGSDLYPFLSSAGLKLGRSFQVVQGIYANESESLAILQLPEHLKAEADQFWLHPALMDGSLHTFIGLLKTSGMEVPLSLPYSVAEVQIVHPLRDLYYGYATWSVDPKVSLDRLKATFHLLDRNGKVLVRLKDFVSKPLNRGTMKVSLQSRDDQPERATVQEEVETCLQAVRPVWNPVRVEPAMPVALPEPGTILLLGGDRLDWVRTSYPSSQLLDLASTSDVGVIEEKLRDRSFDQLLWVAPDASLEAGSRIDGGDRIVEQQEEGVVAVFRIVKALLRLGYANKKLQWTIVTGRTQRVVDDEPIQPAHAGIAGLVGSLAKEFPRWDLRLLDVDSLASVSARECLSLPWNKQGDGLAHRRGEWFQQGFAAVATLPEAKPVYRQNGVYVVIGGAGGVGEVWSRFMIENYQANVVWIGRRASDAVIESKIEALARLGNAPLYVSADATNADSLAQAYETILKTHPAIHGVVQSAIVLQDQSIARLEEPAFRASLAAKVDVSVNMDRVFGGKELDFMLFFSSIISFFKTPGQCNYAAGSTFEDSFALKLQQERAYPVRVMNWGYWGSVGVVADEFHNKMMAQIGLGSIEPGEGMSSLQALVGSDVPQMALIKTLHREPLAGLTVSEAITRQLARMMPRQAPVAAEVPRTGDARDEIQPSQTAEVTMQMETDSIRRIITQKLSEALRMDAGRIRDDAPFAEYGVDSIIGVNFVRTINETLQIELEPASLFEYSTVEELSQYIAKSFGDRIVGRQANDRHLAEEPRRATTPARVEVEARSEHRFAGTERFAGVRDRFDFAGESHSGNFGAEPIAIIGMSGRFAESESLDTFWEKLAQGTHLVKEVSRWAPRDCVMSEPAGHGYCSYGSFIESIDRFDPAFFGISSQEATYMDPQQRLFLEESWRALEDAGYAGKAVHEKQCGVYVGCGSSNYDQLFMEEAPPHAFWGNSASVIPARIAYHLNLQGPAIAVDTACSSSLVAIHLACQGLWARETEMALAGGVFLQATPGFYQVANRAGMLSPDGKTHSFDASANGFVPGEGVGVVVLKRLRDALNDGDYVHGVISGSGINQDGRSNGLTAPNGRAQERLERSVYDRFEINPETIQVVEAHGTGSPLGDSIEYGAISRAFREYTDRKQFCALGTIKTNIGHSATAAGVAGVLKLLLSLKHRQIPPSLHFEKGNPAIDFDSSPFYVNTQLREWAVEGDERRRAAISSFGFSGTNAHLIIEEAPSIDGAAAGAPAYLVALSARTSEQLTRQAFNLLAHLERTPDLPLNDLSFTLFVGRMHLSHRLACVARNQEELVNRLRQWAETGAAAETYASEVQERRTREHVALKRFGNYCIQECREATTAESYLENLTAVADLYAQGYVLDFQHLFPGNSRRIPLPAYPFADERYWVGAAGTRTTRPAVAPAAALHLRPHIGMPETAGQSYGSSVSGAGEDLFGWLQNQLSMLAMECLKVDDGDIATDKVLIDLGFDSLGLTKFASAINEKYQLDITPVLFFDYPSIAEIAQYLAVQRESEIRPFYQDSAAATHAVAPASLRSTGRTGAVLSPSQSAVMSPSLGRRVSPTRSAANEPIAIVGISGVMPQSDDLEAWWENLRNSRNLVTVIPEDRWDWEEYYGNPHKEPNKSNSKWGAFMKEVDKFDSLFFGISPREAQMMDPQQRIFLETVWTAIEDSGQKVSDLAGTRTGLFVGAGGNDYVEVLRNHNVTIDGYSASGNSHSILANRVSFLLDLRGPSAPIDTACSSSLIALHRAVESIHSGSCDMAIVGGVQVMLTPAPYIAFGTAGMLSNDGKCKTFDKSANGYVRGEGVGAMFLKPLSLAEADGNPIYAVVKATAENHGGRVMTLTAPSSTAQAALLIEAYERAQIDPTTVGYMECHGTGTSLGDPIEVQALTMAFSELYKRHGKAPAEVPHCGLGSVKTNIGHLETAAGIAGVLKVLLAIKHKEIPATIHFEELNPYINLRNTPFYIVDELTPWNAPTGRDGAPVSRRAGVSSFGFGGANAHVVLEEYIPPDRLSLALAHGPQLIVLSAKKEDRLKAYMQSLHAYIDRHEVELAGLAYTLQVGRDEMPERLALVVSSTEDLKEKLEEILAGGRPSDCYRHHVRKADAKTPKVPSTEALVRDLMDRNELSKLAELWVSGAKIDWDLLYKSGRPRRISVPTYPFARERHWPVVAGTRIDVRQARTIQPLDGGGIEAASGRGVDRIATDGQEEIHARLQSWVPAWNAVHIEATKRIALPESVGILLLGTDRAALDWLRACYPGSEHLQVAPTSSVESIARELRNHSFDQLLWIAPDVDCGGGEVRYDDERLIEQQESGAVAVFRIIKALLQSGYATKKLQWTVVTGMTQAVTEDEPIHPAHTGIAGLTGTLAQEYPIWDLKLLDVDSLASMTAAECLSLPWDKRGNMLAHRRGEWFQQTLKLVTTLPGSTPVYRQNGVYVVIGGAGGVGEVWSRYMIEHYQANIVWIGRRPYDTAIEHKLKSLARLGNSPLYVPADATSLDSLEQALQTILKTYPVIHGVVHSAVVLDDQGLGRMEESTFRAGYSAKVDISVNMERVFGSQELDFMLFFSSIASFLKGIGIAPYAAGCTFKDSFARTLQQKRTYRTKIMNWGYWGSVGVAADEAQHKIMTRMGIGSIEPSEGMAALQMLAGSDVPQMVLVKTLHGEAGAGLSLPEAIARHLSRKTAPRSSPATAESARKAHQDRRPTEPADQMAQAYVRGLIVEKMSEVLKLDAGAIETDVPVLDYGLDSISGVTLVRSINETLEIELEPSRLLDYTTVDEVTQYIVEQWQEEVSAQMARAESMPGISGDATGELATADLSGSLHPLLQPKPHFPGEPARPSYPQTSVVTAGGEENGEQLLEEILWRETSVDQGYEKVTF